MSKATSTPITSRRAFLTTATALAAGSAVNVAAVVKARAADIPADPILAAIEAHKAAFIRRLETSKPRGCMRRSDRDYAASAAADDEACEAADEAAFELGDTQPTTLAGVLALIDYVRDFNKGKFRLDDVWASAPYNWPSADAFDFEDISDDGGECGMAYAVLLNVRHALAALAVQS